jgi:hypothetical protein
MGQLCLSLPSSEAAGERKRTGPAKSPAWGELADRQQRIELDGLSFTH